MGIAQYLEMRSSMLRPPPVLGSRPCDSKKRRAWPKTPTQSQPSDSSTDPFLSVHRGPSPVPSNWTSSHTKPVYTPYSIQTYPATAVVRRGLLQTTAIPVPTWFTDNMVHATQASLTNNLHVVCSNGTGISDEVPPLFDLDAIHLLSDDLLLCTLFRRSLLPPGLHPPYVGTSPAGGQELDTIFYLAFSIGRAFRVVVIYSSDLGFTSAWALALPRLRRSLGRTRVPQDTRFRDAVLPTGN